METFKIISEHAGKDYLILLGINTATGFYEIRYDNGKDMPVIGTSAHYENAYHRAIKETEL